MQCALWERFSTGFIITPSNPKKVKKSNVVSLAKETVFRTKKKQLPVSFFDSNDNKWFHILRSTTQSSDQEIATTQDNFDIDNELGGCTVGDTKGACLLLEDVAISRGVNQIISSIDWRVERGERWGIVGPNGAGKVGQFFLISSGNIFELLFLLVSLNKSQIIFQLLNLFTEHTPRSYNRINRYGSWFNCSGWT